MLPLTVLGCTRATHHTADMSMLCLVCLYCRCTDLKVKDQQLKDCIYAASLKLEFPDNTTADTTGGIVLPKLQVDDSSTGGTNGNPLGRAGGVHDLAALHAFQGQATRESALTENVTAHNDVVGGTSQLLVLLVVVLGVGFFGFQKIVRGRRLLVRKDQHRAE